MAKIIRMVALFVGILVLAGCVDPYGFYGYDGSYGGNDGGYGYGGYGDSCPQYSCPMPVPAPMAPGYAEDYAPAPPYYQPEPYSGPPAYQPDPDGPPPGWRRHGPWSRGVGEWRSHHRPEADDISRFHPQGGMGPYHPGAPYGHGFPGGPMVHYGPGPLSRPGNGPMAWGGRGQPGHGPTGWSGGGGRFQPGNGPLAQQPPGNGPRFQPQNRVMHGQPSTAAGPGFQPRPQTRQPGPMPQGQSNGGHGFGRLSSNGN